MLDSPDAAVRQRAALVSDALALGTQSAADKHGVSRRTAAEWLRRFNAQGVGALTAVAEKRERQTSLNARILTAPLWMPSTKWSSRTIADSLNVSQSAVARAWRSSLVSSTVHAGIAAWTGNDRLRFESVSISAGGSILLFSRVENSSDHRIPSDAELRRRMRTVLAADLVRAHAEIDTETAVPTLDFWQSPHTGPDSSDRSVRLLALTSEPIAAPIDGIDVIECPSADQWQGLTGVLPGLAEPNTQTVLVDLESRLRRWFHEGSREFLWRRPDATQTDPPVSFPQERGTDSVDHGASERVIANGIIDAIRAGISEGRFSGGEVVTERFLAHRLDTTRGRVREALRQLNADGLITTETPNDVTIPIPTLADIVELYNARQALGAVAIRAALGWSETGRDKVLAALSEVEACGPDDMEKAHHLDQRFQNAICRSASLWRVPGMLESLSQQLLMYIAVLGVRYAFPVEKIVTRDRELFHAIDSGEFDGALKIWNTKIDESATYMVQQLKRHLVEQRTSSSGPRYEFGRARR